jgi:hypothetical protein
VASIPTLLRRRGRRGFRRLVYLSALVAMLSIAPGAIGAPPVITVSISGTLGLNGWYRSNVTVNWTVTGETSSEGCDTRTLTVDTPQTRITCTAVNDADATSASQTVTIKLDKTAPGVSTALERAPDANGWYNHPFTVSWNATDGTSGVGPCSSVRYAGPDSSAAGVTVTSSCSDIAGNVTNASHSFKYDATPPTLFAVTTRLGNRSSQLAWRKSSDTQMIEVMRAPGRRGQGESLVYRGSETGFRDTGLVVGRRYEYRVIGVDQAANRAEQQVNLVATGPLLSPPPGAKVTGPTFLVWTPVRRASYYNVQLIRNGRRVLSAWPDRPSFRLRRAWLYKGRRYRLRPGVYRWYVWPGFGRISAARYSRRPLGSSSFVVAR